jgi:hypothetical protein
LTKNARVIQAAKEGNIKVGYPQTRKSSMTYPNKNIIVSLQLLLRKKRTISRETICTFGIPARTCFPTNVIIKNVAVKISLLRLTNVT